MPHITAFDAQKHHVHLTPTVIDGDGVAHVFRAILDTGAPGSEFSDRFLQTIHLFNPAKQHAVTIPDGLQTQKHGTTTLPRLECLGQALEHLTVYVSRFDESWGIDALIGLDFFRKFRVTIDYAAGQIVTEPYGRQ